MIGKVLVFFCLAGCVISGTVEEQNFNTISPNTEPLTDESVFEKTESNSQTTQSSQKYEPDGELHSILLENSENENDKKDSKLRLVLGGGSKPSRTSSSNSSQVQECPFQNGCVVNAMTEMTLDGCWQPGMPTVRCMIPEAQRVKCYWPLLPDQFRCRRVNGVSECLCPN